MRLAPGILILIAQSVAINFAYSCIVSGPNFGLTADELIDKSKVIVLAVLVEKNEALVENNAGQMEVSYRFRTEETLKGKAPRFIELSFVSLWPPDEHYEEDFNNHTDERFWAEDVGRSLFTGGMCGPDHTFVEEETYLLFPDALNSAKSSEIVRDMNDRWLL